MKSSRELKDLVKEKYAEVADQSFQQNASSCCGSGCGCAPLDTALMADDYTAVNGYVPEADLGLGCGLPTEFALIKAGDTVVDLGSGAGNDAFVARSLTGPTGKVIGIDMTEKMISKARLNAEKMNFNNVEFRLGDIEAIPMNENTTDVVVSNCVLNLVPDKQKAFAEMHRILKPGGHFSVSDIVLQGHLPEGLQKSAEMYAGCVSGAIQKEDYLTSLQKQGFKNVTVQKSKRIHLPEELLRTFLTEKELTDFNEGNTGIYSITVYGEK